MTATDDKPISDETWLVTAGPDGAHSKIVTGWDALQAAIVDTMGGDQADAEDMLAQLAETDEWEATAGNPHWRISWAFEDGYLNVQQITELQSRCTACPSAGVTVKALEWEETKPGNRWEASNYIILRETNYAATLDQALMVGHAVDYSWKAPGELARYFKACPSLDEAKAAAQADYEQRILSALSFPQAQPNIRESGTAATKAVDAIFADLRDRRFLKWLFKREQSVIGDFPQLRSLDLEVQTEIRDAWTAIIRDAIRALASSLPEGEAK